jgi:hypothetical protein
VETEVGILGGYGWPMIHGKYSIGHVWNWIVWGTTGAPMYMALDASLVGVEGIVRIFGL